MLRLLIIVDILLSQVKEKPDIDIAIFGGLALIILMGDFYLFPPLIRKPLQKKAIMTDELYSKAI